MPLPGHRRGGTGRLWRLPAPASRDEAPCGREPRCPVHGENGRYRAAGGDRGGRPAAGLRRGVPGPGPGESTDPLWSTTMTVGEMSSHQRGYSRAVGGDGTLDIDFFTLGGQDYTVRDFYVFQSGGLRFQVNNTGADLSDYTLEVAGEMLPIDDATVSFTRRFDWDDTWLAANAPSLSLANYQTTLAIGAEVKVCLRTATQDCSGGITLSTDATLSALAAERRHARPELRTGHAGLHRNGGELRHADHGDGDHGAFGRDGRAQVRRRHSAHQPGDPGRGRQRHQSGGDGRGHNHHEDLHGDGDAAGHHHHHAARDRHRRTCR